LNGKTRAFAVLVGLTLSGEFLLFLHEGRLEAASRRSTGKSADLANLHALATTAREFIGKYCITCHNQRLRTAGLALDNLNLEDVAAASSVWEKVVRKARAGEMPPSGMPRPDQAAIDAFASWVETALDSAAAAKPNPGHVALHRLNRTEYANAIHDLLDISIDSKSLLPADDADQQGFENIAGILSVSPALLEGYMLAAERISRLAVGDPNLVPVFDTYSVRRTASQDARMSEELPFGSRGGMAVPYYFPIDAQYVVKIHLSRELYGYVIGLGRAQTIEVRLDGERFGKLTVGGEDRGVPAPATWAGFIPGDPKWEEYIQTADASLQVRFPATMGSKTIGVSFVQETSEPEGALQPRNSPFGLGSDEHYLGNAAIDTLEIGGPFEPARRSQPAGNRRIFSCYPSTYQYEETCARKILSGLARRAYRRPLRPTDVESLLRVYQKGQGEGGFTSGIQLALQVILSDPEFLFRVEKAPPDAPPGTVNPISDVELASRLSFFLWSSIPDDKLLAAAEQKKLKSPVLLERQVKRMFVDDRSKALVRNFASQWLELEKLSSVRPDEGKFDFDDTVREALQKETELFLESQIHADRSVKELLDANYTFVNERLSEYYGISKVYDSHLRRVSLTRPERGGLLGQGSILAVTSYPNRTSPVLRGKWVLENVLGMPPPPPPPDVPPLNENHSGSNPASVRERMEQHRRNAACVSCHLRMDSLGFALENFDAIGRWRSTSDGLPIDAAASFPDGTKFEGIVGLRKFLLGRSDQFVRTVAEKLLTYALGRELAEYDFPAVRKIVREAAANDYRWSSIVLGIVKSVPFQMSVAENAQDRKAVGGHVHN
jgi:hypothetical protein